MHVHHRAIMLLGCLVLVCIALFPPRRAAERAASQPDSQGRRSPGDEMWTQPLSRVLVFSDKFHRYWVNRSGDVRKRPTPAQLRRQGRQDAYKRPAVADAGRLLVEALLVIALTAAWIALVGYRAANAAFMEDWANHDGVDGEALPVSRDGVAPDAAPVGRDGKPLYGTTAAPPDPGAET